MGFCFRTHFPAVLCNTQLNWVALVLLACMGELLGGAAPWMCCFQAAFAETRAGRKPFPCCMSNVVNTKRSDAVSHTTDLNLFNGAVLFLTHCCSDVCFEMRFQGWFLNVELTGSS